MRLQSVCRRFLLLQVVYFCVNILRRSEMANETLDLSIGNSMLSSVDIDNLFTGGSDGEQSEENDAPVPKDDETKLKSPAENKVDPDSLFSEGVGGEENDAKETEGAGADGGGSSPNGKFYSSIAEAFIEDGIFQSLDKDRANTIVTAEDLASAVEDEVTSRLDERMKRIDEALRYGVEPTEIQRYENTLQYLNGIDEKSVRAETQEGERIRRYLIYNDFLDRGYSEQRANREVEKSFKGGTDVDDAIDAARSLRESYKEAYDELVSDARKETEQRQEETRKQAEEMRRQIMEDTTAFGGLEIDKATRRKIYDTISKPVWKDKESGMTLTALQKAERDDRMNFLKNVGMIYTLTDGFKSLDKLVGGKVRKEMKKGLRELESKLNNTARTSDGQLRFASGDLDRKNESVLDGKDWDINI